MSDRGLSARGIRFNRGPREILRGADLVFGPGDLVCLLGANGAGKTTLLRLMLGLDRPRSGEVLLDGRALSDLGARAIARRVAYVPQLHRAPFPFTVREVAGLGRLPANGIFGAPGPADDAAVDEVLARSGILHLAERAYTTLSGGERQLVILARALVQGADLLILDEPTTGLDFGNQIRLLQRLRELAGEGVGVLMTTHDPAIARDVSTRAAVLIDGKIAADGPPDRVIGAETIERLYGVAVTERPGWGIDRP